MTVKTKGSLTFPSDPLASMRELSDLDAAPPRAIERNNEGNFIVSQLHPQEATKEDADTDTLEASKEDKKRAPKKGAGEVSSKPLNASKPLKQSLRQAVLDDGGDREERVTKTRLNVDIEEDLHVWLKGHAIQNRRKLNDLIPRILKAYRSEVEGE